MGLGNDMQVVQFNFKLHQKVTISVNGVEAHVTGLLRDTDGCTYRIVYWDEHGARKCEWVYQYEIRGG
jgi:hypothetical protein